MVVTQTTRFNSADITAWRMDGGKVTPQELVELLANPTPMILAKQGEKFDPQFAKMFRPECLVLQSPWSITTPTTAPPTTAPTTTPTKAGSGR